MKSINKMVLSAMFLALALVLPFLTGQIPEIGSMLCPMHIPVILCGFFCGWKWGLAVGLAAPLLRSVLFGMPVMFPTAVCMAFELAVYGCVSGAMYRALPKNLFGIFASLIGAMIAGRLVWGLARFIFAGLSTAEFGLSAFWAGAVINAIPGIILQLVLIPVIIRAFGKAGK